MKKLFFAFALVAVVAMAGCASNTPAQKPAEPVKPAPAPAPAATPAPAPAPVAAPAPTVGSISPTKGRQGSNVTITGSNFGPDTKVMVDGNVPAKIVSVSPNKIVATIPTGLPIGKHTITVVNGNQVSNGIEFIDP